jgi:hypothetical protein
MKLNIKFGMQGRGRNGLNPAWLGFTYGTWLPRIQYRKNSLFLEIGGHWLCFHGWITWWRR